MGASAREIEREIRATRDRMDDNLNRLEGQATSSAIRYARIAAIVLGVVAVGGTVLLIYRRTHRPTLRDRLDDLSLNNLRTLASEATGRLKESLPSVTVRVNEKTHEEPSAFESILRKVAPALVGTAGSALAQDRRQNAPGEFDFYVLSLSWSPSFCEAASERGGGGRSQIQCGGRPFSFVVHGLWPQYEHGFPDYCQRPSPRLDRNIVSSMLDLMPAPRLIFHEWDKHGVCSGLPARGYFETIRKARSAVKIPPEYICIQPQFPEK